ncbi:MAG: helix-hairpin-helix domain-containing protein [Candidatus Methylacidiphilales bacterium]|nr:helix-hairpin-helix domain-containing protein [Candidatus Methylacidiphilales bacterium]
MMLLDRGRTIWGLLVLLPLIVTAAPAEKTASGDLQRFEGCTLIEVDWSDGDSFPVRLPDGREQTVRLYGADCMEWHVKDDSDARRLRTQRRYFGLASGPAEASIARAKGFGAEAASRVKTLLAKPFVIHTAFADGRGDSHYSRVYAFVETAEKRDLAAQLVEEGLARAFGVYRQTPDRLSADDYREHLRDLELAAAAEKRGIWALTNWTELPKERLAERQEDAELDLATGSGKKSPAQPVNPNSASRDELMALPGIGEAMALRIIEERAKGPFKNPEELTRVRGISPATLEKLRPLLVFR